MDRYVLVEGVMLPRETLYGWRPLDRQFLTEYIQAQNDVVKGRGQLGVVPVSISEVDDNGSTMNSSWWILALPFTHEEAKGILQATKWGEVHWVSQCGFIHDELELNVLSYQEARLRDILATPEAKWIRVVPISNTKGQFHFGLPDNLLKEYPFGCLGRRISEMRLNEPGSQFAWNSNNSLRRTERMAGGNTQSWSR